MKSTKPKAGNFAEYLDDIGEQLIITSEALQALTLHLLEYPMNSAETCEEITALLSAISEDVHAEMKRRLLPEKD